ncbi:MAG: plasmid stabilization protein [Gemmatimonadota bacterium]|nr:plasmid stabilization protein [Gemmatimonadota bacterium]
MGNVMIRDISDDIEQRLRIRAAEHGHSIEEEARAILRAALTEYPPPTNLASAIHDRFAPMGGVELEIPTREPMRDPPPFD